jgi:hypothetical protein
MVVDDWAGVMGRGTACVIAGTTYAAAAAGNGGATWTGGSVMTGGIGDDSCCDNWLWLVALLRFPLRLCDELLESKRFDKPFSWCAWKG